jgi:hypothetical protein
MSGESRLGNTHHLVLQVTVAVLGLLRPALKYLKNDAFNPPEVPARAIAGLFEGFGREVSDLGGSYFVVDDKTKSSLTSLDEGKQGEVLAEVCEDLKAKQELQDVRVFGSKLACLSLYRAWMSRSPRNSNSKTG